MKYILVVFSVIAVLGCNGKRFFTKQSKDYPSMVGHSLSESHLGKYFKKDLTGKHLVLLVAYSCSHCQEASKTVMEYKKEGLIDNYHILGGGFEDLDSLRHLFSNITSVPVERITDYDIKDLIENFSLGEEEFSVPVGFYVHNNKVKFISTGGVPSIGKFARRLDQLNKIN